MKDFVLANACLCSRMDSRLVPRLADVRVSGGQIVSVCKPGTGSAASAELLDVQGRVVTAPMVNFHEHAYSRLAKGLPARGTSERFTDILEHLWWRLDRVLDQDTIRASAELTALESVASGVTYVFDHHASPNAIVGSLDTIASVFQDYGLRSVLCYETSDRDGAENARAGLQENTVFARQSQSGNVKAMLGLHAPFTLSDDTLESAARLQAEHHLGIHIHVAEDVCEDRFSMERFGISAATRLENHGLLSDRSIIAHGVHLTDTDLARVARSGAALAVCPDSNFNNAVGVVNLPRIPDAVPLLAGTDGMHANIARTLKSFFLVYRHQGGSMGAAFEWFVKVLTAQLDFARRYFPDYPSLCEGDRADLVVWDYVPPTPLSADNLLGHYIYGVLESRARTVISGGRLLMRDFIFIFSDEARRRAEICRQGERLYQRFLEMNA
jgi:cytosine/adenosine deaminase-related metal-dependent hydrolase